MPYMQIHVNNNIVQVNSGMYNRVIDNDEQAYFLDYDMKLKPTASTRLAF